MSQRVVPCPTCRKGTVYDPRNPWRPFCSQRCRDVDLGAWASGEYRLPAQGENEGDGEAQAGAAATPPIAPGPTH